MSLVAPAPGIATAVEVVDVVEVASFDPTAILIILLGTAATVFAVKRCQESIEAAHAEGVSQCEAAEELACAERRCTLLQSLCETRLFIVNTSAGDPIPIATPVLVNACQACVCLGENECGDNTDCEFNSELAVCLSAFTPMP